MKDDGLIGLVTMKDPAIEETEPGQTYEIGTVGRSVCVAEGPGKTLHVVAQGLEHFQIQSWLGTEP